MHYVRFLKAPKITADGKKLALNSLVTVTSDLGDSFYPADIDLVVILQATTPKQNRLESKIPVTWKSGARQVAVSIDVPAWVLKEDASCSLSVRPVCIPVPRWRDSKIVMPTVLGATTAPWTAKSGAKSYMLRRPCPLFSSKGAGERDDVLNIWEDSGESIARHVWDAGVALVACLDRFLTFKLAKESLMPRLGSILSKPKLKVLELGCGCGLVGIGLAQLLPKSSVVLTDYAEASDIAERNIEEAGFSINQASQVSFLAVDWDDELPEPINANTYDLIMASDVTYNPDSSPALVKTISRLSHLSPQAPILIAMKRRHEAEEVFFNLMSQVMFTVMEHVTVFAPLDESKEAMDDAENIEIYVFGKD